jgi:hypothetical protein
MNVIADLGTASAVNLIALIAHSATADATWRIRGADTEADLTAAPGYDSGDVTMWPSTGRPSGWTKLTSLHLPDSAQTYRWWRIDITDAANPDGFLDIGRLYIAAAWQPLRNLAFGWQLAWVDPSEQQRSQGGAVYVRELPSYRRIDFELRYASEDDYYDNGFELERLIGRKKDILVVPDPAATKHLHRKMIYGVRGDVLPGAVNQSLNIYATKFSVEELPA